jgi:hypothetical protein
MEVTCATSARRLAILQSNYIPWRGYFDLIASVDDFVLLDTVQYTKNDWRNRNRIKTPRGTEWLTIPIHRPFGLASRIIDVRASLPDWPSRHLDRLGATYRRAHAFDDVWPVIQDWYHSSPIDRLSAVNRHFINRICEYLGIRTRLWCSTDFELPADRNDRLIHLCRRLGAGEYLTGPSAMVYLDQERFRAAGIAVRFVNYAGFADYEQLHPPFESAVTVLDPIFHAGTDARSLVIRPTNNRIEHERAAA